MTQHSFDCFRSSDGLICLVGGAASPPMVSNEDTGETMTLVPAELRGGFGSWSLVNARAEKATGLCWTPAVTPLPVASDSEVHLRVEVDGVTYRPVVRWRLPEAPAGLAGAVRRRHKRGEARR
jgi:hypothetical protein